MELNEYQQLAARTINKDLSEYQKEMHSILGLGAEAGEVLDIYQKVGQGHPFDEEHAVKEFGDVLWMIAEWCTVRGVALEDVAAMNIEKLKKRYPNRFEVERSLHRAEGDI